MSQESISTKELEKEIEECRDSHSRLLDYSRSVNPLIIPDMEQQQQQQQWTSTQKQLINEYRIFYQNMVSLISEIESNGPTGKMSKLPKKPKQRLSEVYGLKKVNKEKMTPQELHQYQSNNIAEINHAVSRETFSNTYLLSGNENEENIVDKLNKGIRNLKRQDAQTLLIYINFGNFLNLAKIWMEGERKARRIKQSWSSWLKEKTGYSDDHVRKLRALAKVLFGYDQFLFVGLPLNYILRKLKEISIMLQIPEYNEFWKKPVTLVSTDNLQQSQDVATTIQPQ